MNAITGTQVSRNYWWTMGIRGLLAVLFGLAALVWPRLTLLVLVYLFGAYALVDGVVAVIVSIQERKNLRYWLRRSGRWQWPASFLLCLACSWLCCLVWDS